MDDEVKIQYASSHNITFRGEIETGISRADWDAMSQEEQDQVMDEVVWDLVQLWVEGD